MTTARAAVMVAGVLLARVPVVAQEPAALMQPAAVRPPVVVAEPLSRVAFGSCSHQNREQPIWTAVTAWGPELFVFVGDAVYADTRDTTELRATYAKLEAKPGYQALRWLCPVLGTWDDHDYGENDAGAAFPAREASQRIFLDFLGEPPDSERRRTPGVHAAYEYGPAERRTQVLLLDTRFFRSDWKAGTTRGRRYDPDPDPARTMLGEGQWAWLEAQLRRPARLRLLVSSIQVVNDEHGYECWGNFPRERARLLGLIRNTGAEGVVVLSGDRHFSEISKEPAGAGYALYDFTSSGLTERADQGLRAPNTKRVGAATADNSFGGVVVDWERDDPAIRLEAVGVDGATLFSVSFTLSELGP